MKAAQRTLTALGLVVGLVATTQAGELYGQLGIPGVMLGYAQPVDPHFAVRADYSTIGRHDGQYDEQSIHYNGQLKLNRAGLFVDWFPMAGGFRFTGGVTANDMKLDLTARGTGAPITIGDHSYVFTPADRFDVSVKFPSTTPYLGIGYGHHLAQSGLRFSFDLGAMIGRAKVTAAASGPSAALVSQSDIDKETTKLRDGVGNVRAIPQLSVGLGYSF